MSFEPSVAVSFKFFGQDIAVCEKQVVINVGAYNENVDRIWAIRINSVGGWHVYSHLV